MLNLSKVVLLICICGIMAAVLVLLAVGLISNQPVTGRSGITRVGKPAEEFELSLFKGGEFVLSEQLGRPLVINFWASWCPPCRVEAQLLESAWRVYGPLEVMFVGVNIQDDELDGMAYLTEFEITYPNGRDVHGNITVDYGVIGLPVTFFVGRDGIVKRRWVGSISETELEDTIDELLTGHVDANDLDGENLDQFFKLQKVLDN